MILHLDTSALVKLYVEENHSERVRTSVAEASLVSCHELAYVELGAALARNHGLRACDSVHLAAVKSIHLLTRELVPLQFAVFDTRLQEAARMEGMPVLEAN